jgi:dipeptidyl aminopeptidase/acylaminoacyl peptidase
MKHAFVALAAVVLMVAALRARAQLPSNAPLLTPEQALDRRAIGDLEFSPDGTRLVFTVTEPARGAARARAIWLLDVASDQVRPLTFSGHNDSAPRWSPDGRSIAFLSDRDHDVAQLYRLAMNGGDAERLTDGKDAITAFRWSPDGTRIALLMPEAKPEAQQKRERDKDDSRVVDKDNRRPRVWLLDVASHALTQVTSGGWRIGQIEWLPRGDRLVAAATSKPEADHWTERIYSIDPTNVAGGTFTEIAAPRGPFGGLSVSPDGTTIAYLGARVDGPEPHDVYLQPVAGGAARNVTALTIDRPVGQLRWIDDHTIAATVARGFGSAIASIGSDGRAQFLDADVNPTTVARATNGTIAYAGETATRPPELWLKPANAGARVVTALNASWTSIPVVAPEFVTYKSFDGVEIEAALLRPPLPNSRSATPQPATLDDQPSAISRQPSPFVILVHGGPTGRWSDTFEPWGQLLVARGYAVLYPNIRGSTGYGQRFVEMNRADWGGGDFKDVMAGVDAMIARGVADPARLGIGGWSYGGYMAAWAVTQTSRFKAAVSGAPVIDMASEFGTENGSMYDEWFYGTPYEKLDGFIRSSPITYVKNVKTPTLLLQGEADTTDPIGQSQQFYRGLKRYGVESDFVLYPREPHGLREEKHLIDRLTRVIAWFDRYLKPNTPSTAGHP